MSGRVAVLGRRGFALAALAALAVSCLPGDQPGQQQGGSSGTAGSEARLLVPFFEDLAALEAGGSSGPVRILMIGDSHIANDRFSGRLRALFQSRFGSGGRGMLPPGAPFPYFDPTDVEVSQSETWEVANSLNPGAAGPFGLSGFRITSSDRQDFASLVSTDRRGFDRVTLDYLVRPGGGSFGIEIDGVPQALTFSGQTTPQIATGGGRIESRSLRISVAPGSRRLLLRPTGDGPVSLLSWTVERDERGVVLDSQGVGGATVGVIGRWDPAIVQQQMAERRPSLILFAFGTNEGFAADLDPAQYARTFRQQVAMLRRAAPGVPVVVIGPPDGTRMPRPCFDLDWEPADYSCRTLTPAEEASYDRVFRATSDVDTANCFWHPPPLLDDVREAQRRIAAEDGLYWWNWFRFMGGSCSIHEWRLAEPPLAFPDHVHLREAGYGRTADALFRQIMGQYDAWKAGPVAAAPAGAAG